MVAVPVPEAIALAEGEIVIVFVDRGVCNEGDEIEISSGAPLQPEELKPAYRRWLDRPPPEEPPTAVVVAVDPAQMLDPEAGLARHLRTETPRTGDVVVLRVFTPAGPVLSDTAFAARRRSVEGAMR